MKVAKIILISVLFVISKFTYSQDDKVTQSKKIHEYHTLLMGRWLNTTTKKDVLVFQSGKYADSYPGAKQFEFRNYSIKYDEFVQRYIIKKYFNGVLDSDDFYIKKIESNKLELFAKGKTISYIRLKI